MRDVSEIIAAKVSDVARHEAQELTRDAEFIEAHEPIDQQQTLPLW